jgi:nucleoside-diphosphate-sugar epimerase
MNIFVTGASGFVGNAFVRECAKRHAITAMSRSAASDEKIKATGAAPVRCSLDDVAAEHMKGADAVVHCAAHVEEWGKWADYWRFNVAGTKRMLAGAKKAGAKRFVHIGTEAALFHGQHMRNVDETYPLAFRSPFPYSRTKAYAEKAVREANDPAQGFETIVVRPRFVWGPGDETLLPVVRRMADSGQFAWIGGGHNKTSTTYIGNLVYAMELALAHGKAGEAYFVLDGPPLEFRDMLSRMVKAAGFSLPDREVPGWLVRALAFAGEKAWRALPLPGRPPITRFAANIMSRDCILIDAKARKDMGYSPPFTVEAGMAALAESTRRG